MKKLLRDKWVQIRMDPQERELVRTAASIEGSTLSAWVRRVAVTGARAVIRLEGGQGGGAPKGGTA